MKLKLIYFGKIAEITGLSEEDLTYSENLTITDLKQQLVNNYPQLANENYQIAVDKTVVVPNFVLTKDSEIAVLPPFAGG